MNLNSFLDQNQYPVFILEWLELKKSTYCTIDLLCEFVGISRFRCLKYIEELNELLYPVDKDAKIKVEPSGEIYSRHLNFLTVKKIRAHYLVKSEVFQLLNTSLNLELSLNEFSEKRFLSRTQAYDKRKKLSRLLSEYKLKYKKGKVIGNELFIRNFVYSLYLNYFYGLYNPFSKEITHEATNLLNSMMSYLELSLTFTQKNKLMIFISIVLTRTKHNHFCSLKEFDYQLQVKKKAFEVYQNFFVADDRSKQLEWQYFLTYLVSERIIVNPFKVEHSNMKEKTTCFLTNFIALDDHNYLHYFTELTKELKRLNIKYRILPLTTDFFTIYRHTEFLEENYPSLVKPVEDLNDLWTDVSAPYLDKNRVFDDAFFSVLEIIPLDKIDDKVYVCVDFTQGIAYSNFIINQIEGFKNQNIVVQRKLEFNTDIFISDYASPKLSMDQIIWKTPPNADDWEDFGNHVIAVKQRKRGQVHV